ncbi:MAG: carbon-nitrogen hydrolase family protein [Pseudomonadota bacterium]
MTTFGIASLQLELNNGDNVATIADEIRKLRKRFPWVSMVLVPELASHGTSLKKAEPMPGPTERTYIDLALETGLWIIPGSLYEQSGSTVFNTCPVINPDGDVVLRYRKMYPFLPYEQHVGLGQTPGVFDVPGVGRFGLSICYDMWFPETTRTLACQGAEVILHPSLTNTIDRDVETAIARSSAATNQCYFLDVNCAGHLGVGQSIMAGPGGEVIHQSGIGREIIPLEIDLDYVRRVRERGWQGLGQVLKSYRDSNHKYAVYSSSEPMAGLDRLGELSVPEADKE